MWRDVKHLSVTQNNKAIAENSKLTLAQFISLVVIAKFSFLDLALGRQGITTKAGSEWAVCRCLNMGLHKKEDKCCRHFCPISLVYRPRLPISSPSVRVNQASSSIRAFSNCRSKPRCACRCACRCNDTIHVLFRSVDPASVSINAS